MSRIAAEHVALEAIVYVRQSTVDQVINNGESRRRQYGLVERARQLGWAKVSVIDDDLGRSGSGVSRPGFEKLLAAICEGRVGVVISIEASRLARNGRDWHTLLEFCGLVGTLIADEDGVYDPRLVNDRLLLGMKGTMSEMELSILRQRAHEALKQKARRGELFTTVAIGYVRKGLDQIEKDPDLRVQDALALIFRKFAELQRFACGEDQMIESADPVEQAAYRFLVRKIERMALGAGGQGCERVVDTALPARGHHDRGAILRGGLCGRQADAGRAAQNHDALVLQGHIHLLWSLKTFRESPRWGWTFVAASASLSS